MTKKKPVTRSTVPKRVRDTAKAAAGILRKEGWCQMTMLNEQGQYCLVGAVDAAANGDNNLYLAVIHELQKKLKVGFENSVIGWNDAPVRKKKEVLDLLAKVYK